MSVSHPFIHPFIPELTSLPALSPIPHPPSRRMSFVHLYIFASPTHLTILHLFIYPSIHPSIHSSIPLSTHMFIHSFSFPFFHPSIHPTIHPYVHSFIQLSIFSSIHPSRFPLICSFNHLSIHPSTYLPTIVLAVCLAWFFCFILGRKFLHPGGQVHAFWSWRPPCPHKCLNSEPLDISGLPPDTPSLPSPEGCYSRSAILLVHFPPSVNLQRVSPSKSYKCAKLQAPPQTLPTFCNIIANEYPASPIPWLRDGKCD